MLNRNDRLQAMSWINQARLIVSTGAVGQTPEKYQQLALLATRCNQPNLALDLMVQAGLCGNEITEKQREGISQAYRTMRFPSEKAQQHGHDLLLSYLAKLPATTTKDPKCPRRLIEVGTTRENVPGQGSTLQLAKLALEKGIIFITVDMDPHNSRWASFNMQLLGLPGETITSKGEDYLAQLEDKVDYAFLDAYDFDHGKHSELRQQRYQKYLGNRIDEEQCHLMHLACAKALLDCLADDGLICIDDTWLDEQECWTAKGTLAVPFLLENGFEIIEARNRAVLMKRQHSA